MRGLLICCNFLAALLRGSEGWIQSAEVPAGRKPLARTIPHSWFRMKLIKSDASVVELTPDLLPQEGSGGEAPRGNQAAEFSSNFWKEALKEPELQADACVRRVGLPTASKKRGPLRRRRMVSR